MKNVRYALNFSLKEIPTIAKFTVVAEGGAAPFTYQWEIQNERGLWIKMTDSSSKDTSRMYAGSKTDTFSFAITKDNIETIASIKVRCVITDSLGNSVTSNAVGLQRLLDVTGILKKGLN